MEAQDEGPVCTGPIEFVYRDPRVPEFCLYAQWDPECQWFWLYRDAAGQDWYGEVETLEGLAAYARFWARGLE